MTRFQTSPMLRNLLILDAVTCLGAGALMAIGGGYLASLLALPEPLLRYAGAFLIVFGGAVGLLARGARPPRAAVVAVIVCNALWAVESVAIIVAGWVTPNALGVAFVLAQAVWVAALAALQYGCLRRQAIAAPAA
ncbi:hypothetical protein GCM10019059_13740 [Camelimonas fluminis]|uniref:Integral membrane protein n=1 Tax=Camelimonas fluminis TaxID=1576911 RepID=A0ABV7UL65_9HYPH|nr:hypothetical protein [Camelimonas fluminis]GHE55552.1 hypothetical protein GCM10019059_13740 [Camelimonas fluminis]